MLSKSAPYPPTYQQASYPNTASPERLLVQLSGLYFLPSQPSGLRLAELRHT